MKVINLVCGSFLPERTAGANRLSVVAKTLSTENIVNVIYLVKSGEVYDPSLIDERVMLNNNIKLFPVEINAFSKSNFVFRTLNEISHAYKLLRVSRGVKSDVQIVSIPFLMLLPVTMVFNWFSNSVIQILEIRDLIWRYFEFKKGMLNKFFYHILKGLCHLAIKSFDKVITVTETQKIEVEKFYTRSVTCIANGLDDDSYRKLSSLDMAVNDKTLNIVYAGSIGYPQNLSVLLDASKLAIKSGVDIKIDILGDGPEKVLLETYIKDNNITNVNFRGAVSFEVLCDFYNNAHVLYAQLRNIPSLKSAEPTKIFEYASTGKIILFGIKGDGEKLLKGFENVNLIEPDNPIVLLERIEYLAKNLPLELSIYNRDRVRSLYIRENLSKLYLNEI